LYATLRSASDTIDPPSGQQPTAANHRALTRSDDPYDPPIDEGDCTMRDALRLSPGRILFTVLAAPLMLTTLVACSSSEPEQVTEAPATEVIAPAEPDIRTEEVSYEVDGVTLNGYIAYDAALDGPRPGVLVVHEWWGHNDYSRSRAEQLAGMGYTGMALDMYGDGKLAEHPEDAQKFMMEVVGQLDVAVARFDAARELLQEHPTTDATQTAAIGYCFGGAVVLHMARLGTDLDGVASFHGDLTSHYAAEPGSIRSPILVLHGADDPFVSAESLTAFEQEMADAGANMVLRAYPGAVHSFTNPGATAVGEQFELPLAYDAAADLASWAELDEFLTEIFS